MFENQIILITGGTGSWGHELTRELLKFKPREIRIFSRNEFAQVKMQRTFNSNPIVKFIIGDIRDFQAVKEACQSVDYVFHLAALKHVPICEQQPEETLKTNVIGTQNIVRASVECKIKKVVDVSTDKAVDPINFYGMTKALGEKLILAANSISDVTRFVCVRGGNVLGSNGSVVPLFIRQIQQDGRVTVTSKQMTRFFLTLQEAIALLIHAATISVGGEIFVIQMPACHITDLATVLGKHYAKQPIDMVETGIRAGEKLHEVLVSRYEAERTFKCDHYYVILPSHASQSLMGNYNKYPKFQYKSYDSNTSLMTMHQIEQLLQKGGFLQ